MTERAGYEPSDVHPRGVGVAILVIFAGIAAALIAAWALSAWRGNANGANSVRAVKTAQPALESAPRTDLAAYRAEKRRLLEGYAWVDRDAGRARIPIEAAMRMLAQGAKR